MGSSENLEFWEAVQEYKLLVDESPEMLARAKEIYDEFISDDAPKQVNLNSRNRTDVDTLLEYGSINLFDDSVAEIFLLMKKDTLPRFLRSPYFEHLVEEKEKR